MNNTILTLNRNGLQVIGDNNSFSNVTSRFNNGTGIILNGNNNTLNNSLIQNNTNGLMINGSENHVNSTLIFNNTNGSTIKGNRNNLTHNNVHNNTENGLIINGSNNTFIQNNITGNPNAILVENGTNNTLNYNRVAGNTHNLHNNKKGTVNAEYNWWGQNTPTCITGGNINTGNHAVAVLNVPSGTINPGQIYNITVTLKSSTGEELKMEIPSFLVQFFINNGGDVYPETAPLINNSAWTQFVVFNPGSYTLTTTIDQQTLTNMLSTPVNSQPVTPHKIPRKIADPAPNNNLCGAIAVGNLLNSLGAKADANLISQIGGLTSQGISMHGLSQAASYYGIQLTGLKIDSGQLNPNDIVLLNINGNNHYALILGKLGDNYILQDPFLGTVVMSQEQFNKYYTGNVLTMNFEGLGTLLSIDEMKGLFGGVVDQSMPNGVSSLYWEPDPQKMKDWYNKLPPGEREELKKSLNYGTTDSIVNNPMFKGLLVLICGVGLGAITVGLGAIALPAISVSEIIGIISTAVTGAVYTLRDTIVRYGSIIVNGLANAIRSSWSGATQWASRIIQGAAYQLKPFTEFLAKYLPKFGFKTDNVVNFGFDLLSRASIPFGWNPLTIGINAVEIIATSPLTATRFPWLTRIVNTQGWTWGSRSLTVGDVTALGTGTTGPSDTIVKTIAAGIDTFKSAANDAYNRVVQPAFDTFNRERQEFQKKGLVKYVGDKYVQTKTFVKETAPKVVKYYKSNVRPWMEKNVKPVMHKRLDPVWNHPATQWVVKNVPGARHVTDGLGWFGNKLGVW